jgi:hypothetical protein
MKIETKKYNGTRPLSEIPQDWIRLTYMNY